MPQMKTNLEDLYFELVEKLGFSDEPPKTDAELMLFSFGNRSECYESSLKIFHEKCIGKEVKFKLSSNEYGVLKKKRN